MKKKIKWLSNHPNFYNDFLFNAIHADPSFELEAFFVKTVLETHPWKKERALTFAHREIDRTLWIDWNLMKQVFQADGDTFFIIGGWNNPTMFMVITVLALLKKPFAIWSDTPNIGIKRIGWKQKIRQHWLNFVFSSKGRSRFLVTGKVGVENAHKMGITGSKVFNFPFVTDLDFFKPTPSKKRADKIVFLSSGRLKNDHKGHYIAIEAFGALKKKGIVNFVYRIAGTGPDQGHIKAQIEALGLQEQVQLVGWLELDDLAPFYQSGDVLIHSSFFDPFPNAVLEAMATGLPVIGSDLAGSVIDRVSPGENGYICKAGDSTDWADNIEKILNKPEILLQLGYAARLTAEAHPVSENIKTLKQCLEID